MWWNSWSCLAAKNAVERPFWLQGSSSFCLSGGAPGSCRAGIRASVPWLAGKLRKVFYGKMSINLIGKTLLTLCIQGVLGLQRAKARNL